VALGYTADLAMEEARRCLQCKRPFCVTNCPVQINIPSFIAAVAQGDFEQAVQILKHRRICCRQSAGGFARRKNSVRKTACW
jgi:NADPH-dependent glutamate synthase beta subunit-like oxidoreductase